MRDSTRREDTKIWKYSGDKVLCLDFEGYCQSVINREQRISGKTKMDARRKRAKHYLDEITFFLSDGSKLSKAGAEILKKLKLLESFRGREVSQTEIRRTFRVTYWYITAMLIFVSYKLPEPVLINV